MEEGKQEEEPMDQAMAEPNDFGNDSIPIGGGNKGIGSSMAGAYPDGMGEDDFI
jgi:hypothetical protein